ncbi:MAG TPA: AmmeMemoRadiSam system radical SAM enzyme [Armatimonadota bacterium]|jgi:pyruvate formate lyase activating enzyme
MEARWWEPQAELAACHLCPWQCRIKPGAVGVCGVRQNQDGRLISLNYGQVTSIGLDPIEKKPLYHFHPGASILSLGTFGCNLSCSFCQNWQISKGRPATQELSPTQAVELAEEYRESQGNIGLAYTYNEPFIWAEYVQDTGTLAHERGLYNVLVTNGVVEAEPLEELLPLIDALNVDIKFWRKEHYQELCGGPGWQARETVEHAWGRCHVEITVLIIPGYNDAREELENIFTWAAGVSPDLVVHLSRYHPAYKLQVPPTPPEALLMAYQIAKQHLNYVYVGNINLPGTTDTECSDCGATLVERTGMSARPVGLDAEGRCRACGAKAPLQP